MRLEELHKEEKSLLDLQRKTDPTTVFSLTHVGIPSIDLISEEKVLDKIPNLGDRHNIMTAFFHVQKSMRLFSTTAEERMDLIKAFNKNNNMKPTRIDILVDRQSEITQRTQLLLLYAGDVLDGLTYIAEELNKISDDFKDKYKKTGIKILKLEQPQQVKELRIKVKKEIDNYPDFVPRLLYMDDYE